MKKILITVTLMVVAMAFVITPALAEGWYMGIGIESASFGEDLEDIDNGGGLALTFGYEFTPLFALDFLWGATIHDENLAGGEAAQGNFLIGGKFSFNNQSTFQPYLTIGLANHAVDFDFFQEITGSGLYAGFGADIFMNQNSAINIGFRNSTWSGEDSVFDYDVTTGIFTISYIFYFMN